MAFLLSDAELRVLLECLSVAQQHFSFKPEATKLHEALQEAARWRPREALAGTLASGDAQPSPQLSGAPLEPPLNHEVAPSAARTRGSSQHKRRAAQPYPSRPPAGHQKGSAKQGTGATAGQAANWGPTCNRGGVPWAAAKAQIKGNPTADGVVACLAAAFASRVEDPAWVLQLDDFIQNRGWQSEQSAFVDNSLTSILSRCSRSAQLTLGLDFVVMLNLMQLVTKMESLWRTHPEKPRTKQDRCTSRFYELFVKPEGTTTRDAFQKWAAAGTKFAALAGAGTVYLLMVVAGLEMRSLLGKLPGNIVDQVAQLIRCPMAGTLTGDLVINQMIPAVRFLRQKWPVRLATMFSPLVLRQHSLPHHLEAGDLRESDRFFGAIRNNTFSIPRNEEVWETCLEPVPQSHFFPLHRLNQDILSSQGRSRRSLSPCTDVGDDDIHPHHGREEAQRHNPSISPVSPPATPTVTISTTFNPKTLQNQKAPYPTDHTDLFHWTEAQREHARLAVGCNSLDDLRKKLSSLYAHGNRVSKEKYVMVDASQFSDKNLRLNDANGNFLALVCPALPDPIRTPLLSYVQVVFGELHDMNTQRDGEKFQYPAIHFDWYNRHNPRGDDAPEDVAPTQLAKPGKKRIYAYQLLPRVSQDLINNLDEYQYLGTVLESLFQWIRATVEELLPDHTQILTSWCDVLPNNDLPPTYPFSGLVVNLDVVTRAHRDRQDLAHICLVLVVGEFEGGELCLFEPGLVFKLRSGDVLMFTSSDTTHFNLHSKGRRASLVFHSDRAGMQWAEDRNGWETHTMFRTTG